MALNAIIPACTLTRVRKNCNHARPHGVLRAIFDKFLQEGIMAKAKRGLDNRHRDKSGKIERKHGNTKVAALRKEYGEHFAAGHRKDMMLKTLLKNTGCASLHEYLRQHHK
jgi:hypothetical protein